MHLSLVKKDFDIVFCGNVVILLAQMIFILIIISVNMGEMGYGVMVTAFGWQILMSVSAKEKGNNCLGLLIAMPLEKGKIITTRYITTMISFVGITIFYEVLAIIVNVFHFSLFKPLTPEVFFTTLCVYALFISITLPLYFKFDDTVVRGISLFLIMAVTMVGYALWDIMELGNRIGAIVVLQQNYILISLVLTVVSLVISRNITFELFKNMEF